MALGSTQPLTEMSTGSISCGQRRPVRKADNLPPSCAVVMKSGNLNFLEPSGPPQACNGTALPLNSSGADCKRELVSPKARLDGCRKSPFPRRTGDRGSTVVKVLCYKSEGRCFDLRLCQWIFSLT